MSEHEEDKIVTPINEVLAVLPTPDKANEAIRDLKTAGFSGDRVRLLEGSEADDKIVGSIGQNAGLATKLFKFFEQMHTDASVILEQYREAGKSGKEVLAVKIEKPEEVDIANEVLSRHYAENIRYFGTLGITDLSVPRPAESGRG